MKIHDVGIFCFFQGKHKLRVCTDACREKQYAASFKAQGTQKASEIRAKTDVEVARIKADAMEDAAKIGDAEASGDSMPGI